MLYVLLNARLSAFVFPSAILQFPVYSNPNSSFLFLSVTLQTGLGRTWSKTQIVCFSHTKAHCILVSVQCERKDANENSKQGPKTSCRKLTLMIRKFAFVSVVFACLFKINANHNNETFVYNKFFL